jgi:hypothetical protein
LVARGSLLALVCLLAIACGGGPPATPSAKPSTSPSTQPSASASGSGGLVDEAFCGTVADMESQLAKFEALKIRASNRTKLKDQSAAVKRTLPAISAAAAADLTELVDALSTAVDGLTSAAEDYATSSNADAASKRVKRAITDLHGAITDLREAAICSN